GTPAQCLDRDLQVLIEAYWVQNVPAIEAPVIGRVVIRIGGQNNAGISGGVKRLGDITAAKIILGARGAKGRKFPVRVHEELYLAFAEPAFGLLSPGQKSARVATFAADTINDDIRVLSAGISAAPLRVEIAGLRRNRFEGVIDLEGE